MQHFQEVLCVQTARYEPRALIDHHRQNFFAALVDDGNLVEIDDPIACRRTIPSGLPVRDQFCYAVFSQPTLKDPSLFSIDLLHRNP